MNRAANRVAKLSENATPTLARLTPTRPPSTAVRAPSRAETIPAGSAPTSVPIPYAAATSPTPPFDRSYVRPKCGRSGVSAA